jgi:glycosyltransferase involved in cell wall biosynthesis
VILIPKAFEREHANRVFAVIEALRLVEDALDGYEIHLLMCSKATRTYLRQMPESLQRRCRCHNMLPQPDLFEMLGKTRAMVALSLSDGTPNVMLEAIGAGALPVVSPIESIQEWITDGENGLLANALYPDQIAAALQRALTDDALFERAQRLNWEIISQRADRKLAQKEILTYYSNLACVTSHP